GRGRTGEVDGGETAVPPRAAGARWGAATGGAAGEAAVAGAAVAEAPLSVSITATSVCTGTVCPSWTLISARTPADGAGVSASTLSVAISNSGSSPFTSSPSFLSQLLKASSGIGYPILGMTTCS